MNAELALIIINLALIILALLMRYWNRIVIVGCLIFIFANVAGNFGLAPYFLIVSAVIIAAGAVKGFRERRKGG
jgi:hypothetical protein